MKTMRPLILALALLGYGCSDGTATPTEPVGGAATAPATDAAPAAAQPGYQNLSPEDFAELMGWPDAVLLDVRTPAEVAGGKIGDALEIDYRGADFADRLAELPADRTYLVYCAAGGRSSRTCEQLVAAGFPNVYNLEGGYAAWKGE